MAQGQQGTKERRPSLWSEARRIWPRSIPARHALDDPLEAAVFSILLELVKEMDKAHRENESGEIPISNLRVNA
jgi:hypothetical protein